MGFSTSGAVLVILIGVLVAVSVIVPTLFSVGAQTGDAFSTQSEQLRDQVNTDIEIESFERVDDVSGEEDELSDEHVDSFTLNVTNTGSNTLSVDDTDVVIVGDYYPVSANNQQKTSIVVVDDGDRDERETSDAWLPGTHLEVEFTEHGIEEHTDSYISDFEDGDPVQVTTERGISNADELTVTELEEGDA